MNDLIKWTNSKTQNVAKWIDTDPAFYNITINNRGGRNAFLNVRAFMKLLGFHKTPDQVSFWDEELDLKQLHNFIKEL